MEKFQEPSHRRYKTTNNNSDSSLARRDYIEEEYAAFSGEVKRCTEFATEYQSQQSSSSNFPVSLSRRQSHARWIRPIITAVVMVGYFIMIHYNYASDIEYGTSGRGSSTTNTIRSDTSLLSSCTNDIYTNPEYIPSSANKQRVEWVQQAQDILTYIFTKLYDAPAILMYGTLLYEYRNSTVGDPCVHSSLIDKDIDIAVYPIHIQQIAAMKYDIKQKFNWELTTNQIQHSFISIFPTNYWIGKYWKRYRIDIYGFQYDSSTSGLINFQWDGIKISKNAFLPIRKYKQMKSPKNIDDFNGQTTTSIMPTFYIPNNPHNIICNLYGADYMTPKTGHRDHDRPGYGNVECGNATIINPNDEQEIEKQLDASLFSAAT